MADDSQTAAYEADTAAAIYRLWEARVETARMIMAAAIADFDECRAKLREAEQRCQRLARLEE